jgi:hypothetical protein
MSKLTAFLASYGEQLLEWLKDYILPGRPMFSVPSSTKDSFSA